jgi:hypothetical protein
MKLNPQICNPSEPQEARVAHQPRLTGRDAPQRPWTPDRVVINLHLPHLVIAQALKRCDDSAIWREYARARDQDAFIHCLSRLAGTYSTQQTHFRDPSRTTEWHHELVAVPFLLPAGSWPVPAPSAADRVGAGSLMGEVQEWAGPEQMARLVLGCVKYVDLVSWSPVSQQEYLQLLAGERTTLSTPPDEFGTRLPEGCVQLAFAIGSVRCWNAQPLFPDSCWTANWKLRTRMAACLSYMNQCHVPMEHVLPPAPLADAVLVGLRMWVAQLAKEQRPTRWDVQLGPKDVLYLELTDAEDYVSPILLPVRRHQVAAEGLSELTSELAARFGNPTDGPLVARAPIVH